MSPLTDAEKQKIIEEERIRADERAKYSQPQPVVTQKKKGLSNGAGCLIIIIALVIFSWALGQMGGGKTETTPASPAPSTTVTKSTQDSVPLGIKRDTAISYFKKLGFSITASDKAADVYVGTTPSGGAKGYNVLQLSGPAANLNRIFITGVMGSDLVLTKPTIANVISFAGFFGDDSKAWITEQVKNIAANAATEQHAVKVFNHKQFDYTYSPSAFGVYLEVTGVK
jgi:hypothetical protein